MTCKLSGVVSPCFAKVHREIKAGNVKELVAKGGRGSTKSSYISIELILPAHKASAMPRGSVPQGRKHTAHKRVCSNRLGNQ